jgi:hypothetical protein
VTTVTVSEELPSKAGVLATKTSPVDCLVITPLVKEPKHSTPSGVKSVTLSKKLVAVLFDIVTTGVGIIC